MAVFRNYYNRRPLQCIKKWSLAVVTCLYLLCSTINFSIVGAERIRHRHSKAEEDVYVSQLEKTAIEESSKTPVVSCPNCLYKSDRETVKSETDNLRLEAIKRQILSKLGLRHKPNVTHSLPREIIMETLFRAEDSAGLETTPHDHDDDDVSTTSARTSRQDVLELDDFYGRTSEIISFAEEGFLNGNRLLQFRVSTDPGQAGQELRVRAATLWIRAEKRQRQTTKCQTAIWVFKIKSTLNHSPHELNAKDKNDPSEMITRLDMEETKAGWQKFDITSTVREWLVEPTNEKLDLLVDCSCCVNWRVHFVNTDINRRNDPNRPFLVIHTDPNTAKRVRRRALDCSVDSGNQCCKQRFYVNFKQLGWDDWVIAPAGYYANYCRGDCGHHRTPDTYVTYHTHVIEEIRKTHHLSGMQPCCAPLKFSSMSLIYFGPDSTIIKRDLPKMVVDECGCP